MSKSKLDVPVGTVVSYRKKQLRVEEGGLCTGCYFRTKLSCNTSPCGRDVRKDDTNVIFKLVTNEQA